MQEVEESKQQHPKPESPEMVKEDIAAEEKSKLSEYHKCKLFIGFLKVMPMILAGLFLLNTVLSYFYIDWTILSYLASVGIIPWLFIMLASYRLKFCEYHRMFLWYILVNNILCWVDYEYTLPVSNKSLFLLHIIVAGLFLFLVLYFHQKCRD
jgi:hypothetical protein